MLVTKPILSEQIFIIDNFVMLVMLLSPLKSFIPNNHISQMQPNYQSELKSPLSTQRLLLSKYLYSHSRHH